MIDVHCAYDEMVQPDDLTPNEANPRDHSLEQIDRLCRLITHHGWRSPIIVSNLSGKIVTGHGRYLAAKSMGTEIPVVRQDFDSESDENAHLLADNQIGELSHFHPEKLKNLLDEVAVNLEIETTGMTDEEMRNLLSDYFQPDFDPKFKTEDVSQEDMDWQETRLGSVFEWRVKNLRTETIHCPKCSEGFDVNKEGVN
jgi:ParB-like chromosome segregation protein Spo0J